MHMARQKTFLTYCAHLKRECTKYLTIKKILDLPCGLPFAIKMTSMIRLTQQCHLFWKLQPKRMAPLISAFPTPCGD